MTNPLDREMEIARQIQASFLPDVLPQFPGWEIAARFQPAQKVGGDFYDAFPLIQNRRLGLVIGDVCDKSVGAALFMALFRTLIRAFAQQHHAMRWMGDLADKGLAKTADGGRPVMPSIGASTLRNTIELTNEYIATTHSSANMFATIFFCVLDPTNGSLLYINGGHEYPLLVNSSGVKDQLSTTGPIVGIFPGAHFDIREVHMEPGETLVAFTDGVLEAQNPSGEPFGSERLHTLLAKPIAGTTELLDCILSNLAEFTGGADPSDDITLLALRRQ